MSLINIIAKSMGVPLIDYGSHRGAGILLSSGSGIMMAMMDACPCLRWCVDIDEPAKDAERWLAQVSVEARPVVAVGWFSISPSDRMRRLLASCRIQPMTYLPFYPHQTYRAFQLGPLIEELNNASFPKSCRV